MSNQKATRIPSYRLHKPTGLAVVRLNGRDFYLGKHGTAKGKAEYERLIAEWLTHHRQLPAERSSSPSRKGPISISELILAYWRHAEAYYVKDGRPTSTLHGIKSSIRPLHELYGHTPASAFGPVALKTTRQAIIDQGLSHGVVNKFVGIIKRMFRWGAENEMIPPSVYHGLQTVSGLRRGHSAARETTPVRPVPEPYVKEVLHHVSRQVAAMIQLQLYTGMRPEEATTIRGCDLDTTGTIWIYRPGSHKTEHHGHERIIYVGPQAQEVVQPFLKADLGAYLFSPQNAKEEQNQQRRATRKTPMTPSQAKRRPKTRPRRMPGRCYTTGSYARAIARACENAGVPHWSPNQLRHNAATFLRKEFGIDAARIILGHRSPAVTEVYAELDHAKAIDIMNKVG